MLHPYTTPRKTACLTLLLALLFSCWQAQGQAAETAITAHIEPNRIAVGEEALLTVTIQGQRDADPEIPDVAGLRITPLGRSTQIQFINGSLSTGITLTYRVQAEQAGSFTIAPIRIKVDGKMQATRPLRLEVVDNQGTSSGSGTGGTAVRPPSPHSSTDNRFDPGQLVVVPEKNEMYSGELLPVTIMGFFRRDRQVTVQGQPTLAGNGFILESLDEEPIQEEVVKDGIPCVRLTWRGTVSPIRQGTSELKMSLPITVLIPEKRRLPTGMFNDPFFDLDSFFTHYRKKEITLQSQPISIQVLPLPDQGRPEDFSGAVGTFSLQVRAHPTSVAPGDPINLTITITGQGNFDRVKAPVFTGTEQDWKIYPPSRGEMVNSDQSGKWSAQKSKQFEQAIIPRHAGIKEIPPLRFTYFDPEKKKYQTVTSSPIPLHIIAGASLAQQDSTSRENAMSAQPSQQTAASSATAKPAQPGPVQDTLSLAPIHTTFGQGVRAVQPLWQKTWFQILAGAVSMLFLLAVILLWQQYRLQGTGAEKVEKKRQQQELMDRLKQLDQAAANGEVERFFTLLRQIIQDHFGHQWQGEARAITAADLASQIGEDAPLTRLLRAAEHAVFAPPELSLPEMEKMVAALKKEVGQS